MDPLIIVVRGEGLVFQQIGETAFELDHLAPQADLAGKIIRIFVKFFLHAVLIRGSQAQLLVFDTVEEIFNVIVKGMVDIHSLLDALEHAYRAVQQAFLAVEAGEVQVSFDIILGFAQISFDRGLDRIEHRPALVHFAEGRIEHEQVIGGQFPIPIHVRGFELIGRRGQVHGHDTLDLDDVEDVEIAIPVDIPIGRDTAVHGHPGRQRANRPYATEHKEQAGQPAGF